MTAAPARDPCLGERAAGLAMVAAWGDALGARYEAIRWAPRPDRVRLGRGVLVWRTPGWWTDDTDMSLGVMLACRDLLQGGRPASALADDDGRLSVLRRWLEWHAGANPLDAGLNTWRVLHRIGRVSPLDVEAATAISQRQLRKHHRGGGNGAVMRTAPVALAFPGDPQRAWAAAAGLAELTHPQPAAVNAAGLWTVLCERALVTGELQPDMAAAVTAESSGDGSWAQRLAAARPPGRNGPRGWAPTSVADAWWCVREALDTHGTDPAAAEHGLRLAVSSGQDPDTTAAIAGGLLGALCGDRAVDANASERVHGGDWTGSRWSLPDLGDLARAVVAASGTSAR